MKLTVEALEGFVKTVLLSSFEKPSPIPDFHRELWDLCCSDHPLVAIAAPRGHAKSTAISLVYTLASVLFREAKFVVMVSNTEDIAQKFLETIKAIIESNEDIRHLFGIKSMPLNTKTDIIVEMDDGWKFRITAKGSGQKVRGLNWDFYRPDLIIGDDLENDEMVMNDERREEFRRWFIETLLPIRGPTGRVRVVGTILHMDSLLARLVPLEGDRGTEEDANGLRFTFAPPKHGDLKAGRMFKGVLFKGHVGDSPNDIKKKSDMLWPERFDRQWYMEKYWSAVEIGHPEGYSQEYLNRPLDPSLAYFRKSDLVPMSKDDHEAIATGRRPLLFYAGGDLAITEKEKGDYTAFVVVGIDSDGIMYVLDVIRARFDGRKIVTEIIGLQKRYNLQWFALEQEKTMKSIMPFLREEMIKPNKSVVNVIPIIPHTDKRARATSMQGRMRMGTVKFNKGADWYPVLEQELLSFDRGKHDDQVDALSCIGIALQKLSAAATAEEEAEEQIRELEEESLRVYDGRSAVTGY